MLYTFLKYLAMAAAFAIIGARLSLGWKSRGTYQDPNMLSEDNKNSKKWSLEAWVMLGGTLVFASCAVLMRLLTCERTWNIDQVRGVMDIQN